MSVPARLLRALPVALLLAGAAAALALGLHAVTAQDAPELSLDAPVSFPPDI